MKITDQELLDEIETLKAYILGKRASHTLAKALRPDTPCDCEEAIRQAEWCLEVTQQLYDLRQIARPTTD